MEREQGRRMSVEEKLGILEEGRELGSTVSEACRRHQVSHAQFYRWQGIARQGVLEALRNESRKARNGKPEEMIYSVMSTPLLGISR